MWCHKAKFPGPAPCKSAPSHTALQVTAHPPLAVPAAAFSTVKRHKEYIVCACMCASLCLKQARVPWLWCKQMETGRDTLNWNLVGPWSHRCSFSPQLMLAALLLTPKEMRGLAKCCSLPWPYKILPWQNVWQSCQACKDQKQGTSACGWRWARPGRLYQRLFGGGRVCPEPGRGLRGTEGSLLGKDQ